MESLTKREKQVLMELVKNARISDQAIARKIGTSRPTVAKIRKRLESKGIILRYTTHTAFEKLGLNISALTLYRWNDYSRQKELQENIKFIRSLPQVVKFVRGEGIGSKTKAIVSVHETLKDYEDFIVNLQEHWGQNVHDVEVFLSSIDTMHKRIDISGPIIHKLTKDTRATKNN